METLQEGFTADENNDKMSEEDLSSFQLPTDPSEYCDDGKTGNDIGPDELLFNVRPKFSFRLTEDEWSQCTLLETKQGNRRLAGQWSEIFVKKIMEKNPFCPLVFKRNQVVRPGTRKRKCNFFNGRAVCMFPGCTQYNIMIVKHPKPSRTVKVKVVSLTDNNYISHPADVLKGRPIKGEHRRHTAYEISRSGPSNVFYNRLSETPPDMYEAGNKSLCSSKQVMQKISSEINVIHDRRHHDAVQEIIMMKEIYDDLDEGDYSKNCIKYISSHPFAVHIYTEHQIKALVDSIAADCGVLYFDATGSILAKISGQNKPVFYYALLLKGIENGDPPVPVAELISNSHNTVDVANFLMRVQREIVSLRSTSGMPQRVEIDNSWVMIHATLIAFNGERLSHYLHTCWKLVMNKLPWPEQTIIHICSAHVLHKISMQLSKIVQDKNLRKYILHVIGILINATSMDNVCVIFHCFSVLLLSKSSISHAKFHDSKVTLDGFIASQCPDIDDDVLEDSDRVDFLNIDDCACEYEPVEKQPGNSLFAQHFKKVISDIEAELFDDDTAVDDNIYHSPATMKYICNNYMSITPLWTGIIMHSKSGAAHDTNSPAENWMRILKKDVLQDKKRLRPGKFIRLLRKNVNGRIREYSSKIQLHRKRIKSQQKLHKETLEGAEEKWGKRKKTTDKKSLFLSPPKNIPTPASKQKKTSVQPGKKQKVLKTEMYTENGLHWGGKVQLPDGTMHMSNTCPVDNLLTICYAAAENNHVLDWFKRTAKINVLQVLLEIFSLFKAQHFAEGRAFWLSQFCKLVPKEDNPHTLDVWGGEAERFVKFYGPAQETVKVSTCSKRLCPVGTKRSVSQEILLGGKTKCKKIRFEDGLAQWEESEKLLCLSGPEGRQCTGERTCQKRHFLNEEIPALIIVSASFLSGHRGLKPNDLPEIVTIIGRRYRVFGYTVCVNSNHFIGFYEKYIGDRKILCKYDALDTPEIREVQAKGYFSGMLEHVVLITCE